MSALFFLTACEPSGDRLGAAIIKALQQKLPDAKFIGVAGPLMRAAGCEVILPQEDLAVMGFIEVLKQLPRLLKARKFVAEQALAIHPDVYIGIDAPDFNLAIETFLKENNIRLLAKLAPVRKVEGGSEHKTGVYTLVHEDLSTEPTHKFSTGVELCKKSIKTVHVNSPTVWAWRSGRIKKIKKAVDLMLTLFPFENAIYEQNQIPVKFIGHPLASDLPIESQKQTAREQLGLSQQQKVLALMPGSRSAIVKHLTPAFLEAAKICLKAIPDLIILAPMIDEKRAEQFRSVSKHYQLPIQISIGNAHQVLQAADAVLISSGTATLEAMLCHTPMVVAYKMDTLSMWIARRLVKIPHVSLPNILANKELVPEFIQEQATPENLAQACLHLLQQPDHQDLINSFNTLHQTLQQDSAANAADAIISIALK